MSERKFRRHDTTRVGHYDFVALGSLKACSLGTGVNVVCALLERMRRHAFMRVVEGVAAKAIALPWPCLAFAAFTFAGKELVLLFFSGAAGSFKKRRSEQTRQPADPESYRAPLLPMMIHLFPV